MVQKKVLESEYQHTIYWHTNNKSRRKHKVSLTQCAHAADSVYVAFWKGLKTRLIERCTQKQMPWRTTGNPHSRGQAHGQYSLLKKRILALKGETCRQNLCVCETQSAKLCTPTEKRDETFNI